MPTTIPIVIFPEMLLSLMLRRVQPVCDPETLEGLSRSVDSGLIDVTVLRANETLALEADKESVLRVIDSSRT